MRFLKMVERKKEAGTAKQLQGMTNTGGALGKTPQKRNNGEMEELGNKFTKSANKSGDEDQFEERDMLWNEGLYELHRKRKVNQRLVRGYC
jgi:hypothetical protein